VASGAPVRLPLKKLASSQNALNRANTGSAVDTSRMPFARTEWAIGLIVFGLFCAFSVAARFRAPYRDDWDWLNAMLAAPVSWQWLFAPHNEHVIPLARLLHLLQYRMEGGQGVTLFAMAVCAQVAIGAVYWREVRLRWTGDDRLFLTGLVTAILFSTFQLQSIVFSAAILFPLVQLFALLATAAILNAHDDRARSAVWTLAAVLGMAGAILSTTNGFSVPIIIGLVALRQQRRPWLAAACVVTALSCIAGYALHVGVPWHHGPPPAGQRWGAPSVSALAAYFLTFYGSALAYANIPLAIVVGTALFVMAAFAILRTIVDGQDAPRVEWFATAVMLFACASDAMATVGRAQFGAIQAAQSRYGTFAFAFHAALALWTVSRVLDRGHRPALERAALPVLIVSLALIPANAFVGTVWKAKADNITSAGLAVSTGVADDEWVATLHPLTNVVYEASRRLSAVHDPVAFDSEIGRVLDRPAATVCAAGAADMTAIPAGPGWRVRAALVPGAAAGLVVDRSGTIVGRLADAPLITRPNPLEPVVVALVLDAYRHGTRASGFLGFARPGAGAPYAVYPIDGEDRPMCRIDLPPSASEP
jgi:hypothetical protein